MKAIHVPKTHRLRPANRASAGNCSGWDLTEIRRMAYASSSMSPVVVSRIAAHLR